MKKYFVILLILILFFSQYWQINSIKGLKVTYLDIGQGDATLIRTPDNFIALVDAGPDVLTVEKLGKILNFYERRIDLLLISHFDADHIGGIPEIEETYTIERIVYNKQDVNLKPQIHNVIDKIPIFLDVFANRKMNLGCCVSIEFLWPQDPLKIFKDVNSGSITFIMNYQNISFFFSGDLPKEQERLILERLSRITIFKIGHHGSSTSTAQELLNKVKPKIAVISVGLFNRYGHPHQQVLQLLNQLQIPVVRTDEHGGINIITDGNVFEVILER